MCGIAGIFNYADLDRPADRQLLERMTRALAHRGPDGEGYHVDGPLGFGHRRLSIVDLTPSGQQPMASSDGRYWITYNGELYNHRDFRSSLEATCRFRGTSDTETLVNLLAIRGEAALRDLVGIYGFAIWDSKARRLMLVRDMLGVKQLYYHDDGRRVLFASEIKALLASESVSRDVDPEGVNQYLHFHTPLFERTLFQEVKQLKPAELVEFAPGRGPRREIYWQVDEFCPNRASAADNTEELRALLQRVVREQLMSDVPVGAFFSGGIDSTAVAAYAARSGAPPLCFGVHFSGQGVIDERPFQEAAAKALGLELQLTTVDGSAFPEDMARLLAAQDGPLIGPAMIPMDAVSRLAAGRVKVCMGGQAADETFGGYARYALCEPISALLHWAAPPTGRGSGQPEPGGSAAGNLRKQFLEKETLLRLLRTSLKAHQWRARYFYNFAKTAEHDWLDLLDRSLVSRQSCWRTFQEATAQSRAQNPATIAMHWDLQTYLPGLFTQDDRMSMAHGLESRVPFADPRLVKFAFRVPFSQKFRRGSSKWLLRQVVADVLPSEILNRRKVGFDTPAQHWIRDLHQEFVRSTLLSTAARQRGWLQPSGVERLLGRPLSPGIFERIWKILCLEVWAQNVIDRPAAVSQPDVPSLRDGLPAPLPQSVSEAAAHDSRSPNLWKRPLSAVQETAQELREMGRRNLSTRLHWEVGIRSGAVKVLDFLGGRDAPPATRIDLEALPFAENAGHATRCFETTTTAATRAHVEWLADQAVRGRVHGFGRAFLDFGDPIDWHLNPASGRHWRRDVHWSRILGDEADVGDVKVTWEAGRFPQAFVLARAAHFMPDRRQTFAGGLVRQIEGFLAANPYPLGVHWASGQEIAIRLCSWAFALSALRGVHEPVRTDHLASHLGQSASHIERHIRYARDCVYNNHLLYEALALELVARLLPDHPRAAGWRSLGRSFLEREANSQFYEDGAYIQESHNYQRTAVHCLLLLAAVCRRTADPLPGSVSAALERALAFLYAHLNPADGRLPNYGANDGSHPLLLSSCDFSDFRPVLQATSMLVEGKRRFEPGPWDELGVWLFGEAVLNCPVERRPLRTSSFSSSGYHVLRTDERPDTFLSLRCGNVRERFSQIDMLSLSLFWRGHEVIADPGSYQYNADDRWHHHFHATASHSTVTVDGEDQMLHRRRFSNVYWTEARTIETKSGAGWSLCAGEHQGYARPPIASVHRRSVLLAEGELFVVADQVTGAGEHRVAVHFLGGDFPHDTGLTGVSMRTPAGPFSVAIYDGSGTALALDVVRGQSEPPRGWLSRYYRDKVPVPSIRTEREGVLPVTFVTVMCGGGEAEVQAQGDRWSVVGPTCKISFSFADGLITDVRTGPSDPVNVRRTPGRLLQSDGFV